MCVLAQGRGRQLKRSIFLTGPYCRFSFIEIPSNDFRLSIIISPSLLICSSPLFYFILTIIRQSLSSETKLFQIQILLVIRSLQIFIISLINCLDNVQNVSSKFLLSLSHSKLLTKFYCYDASDSLFPSFYSSKKSCTDRSDRGKFYGDISTYDLRPLGEGLAPFASCSVT